MIGASELIVRASGTLNALGPALITACGALAGIVVSVLFDRKRPGRHEKGGDGDPTPDEAPDRDDITDAELHEMLTNRALAAEGRETVCNRELANARQRYTRAEAEWRRRYDDFVELAHVAQETSHAEIARLRELCLKLGYDPVSGDRLEGR